MDGVFEIKKYIIRYKFQYESSLVMIKRSQMIRLYHKLYISLKKNKFRLQRMDQLGLIASRATSLHLKIETVNYYTGFRPIKMEKTPKPGKSHGYVCA